MYLYQSALNNNMLLKLFLFIHFVVKVLNAKDLIVKINEGFITGKYMTSTNGRQFAGFVGVPYAEPPINHLRFMVHRYIVIK